LLNRGIAT
jgi:hypothetical protein